MGQILSLLLLDLDQCLAITAFKDQVSALAGISLLYLDLCTGSLPFPSLVNL